MEIFLFAIGGILYTWIEILWRGWTHWSMFILGGACFVVMGLLNEYKISWHWCLLRQSVISACVITIFEFLTGCIVNLWLGLQIWDYSTLPFNLFGQICIYYFFLWVILSVVGIVLDDWIRYITYLLLKWLFPWMQVQVREHPHYKLI